MELKHPSGEIVYRSVAMPADTNANGDMFGGWLLSQMDLGGAILAKKITKKRVVTVALDGLSFIHPVRVGDVVTCYANVVKIGNSSIKICVSTWVYMYPSEENLLVTEGVFTYVALDENNKPTPISA